MYQVRKHPNKIMFSNYEVCNHLLEVHLLDWQMDFLTPFVHACAGNLVRADVVQVPAVATSCAHHWVDVLSRNSAGSIWQSGKTVCWSQVCILLAKLWISNNCNFIPPLSSAVFVLITYTDRTSLYCSSEYLIVFEMGEVQAAGPTAFCTLAGLWCSWLLPANGKAPVML